MHSQPLALCDVIKFAVEKEQESEVLYSNFAEHAVKPELKSLFQRLMQEEKRHEELYTNMLLLTQQTDDIGLSEHEHLAYVAEIIRSGQSESVGAVLQFFNAKAALDYAIAREKESILLYVGLKNLVPYSEQSKVEAIIREESRHMAVLSRMKADL